MWYVGGPMSHRPAFNYYTFDQAALDLRTRLGLEILNPSELDDPKVREAILQSPDGEFTPELNAMIGDMEYKTFLARDVDLLMSQENLEGMIVLPEWQQSTGARLETFVVAVVLRKPVLNYPTMTAVSTLDLIRAWFPNHKEQ